MQNDFFTTCLNWLQHHADSYRQQAGEDESYIDRKLRHTMRVLGHVRAIIPETGASPDLPQCMEVAAVLHDAGRFPQLIRQKASDGHQSFNHGEAGAKIVQESGLLAPLTSSEQRTILDTIRHHNAGTLPFNLEPDSQLCLDLVRNADKLDAIRNNLKYLSPESQHGKTKKLGITWDKNQASSEVIKLALNRQLIPFRAIKWSNDFILFLCCWLYDLHFPYSFRQLQESGNFDTLLDKLPDTDQLAPLKSQLRQDLDWIVATSGKK